MTDQPVYEAGKRVRIHRVFTPDVEGFDVTASTATVMLTDYTTDPVAITDITTDATTNPTASNVDVVVEWSIPDDAATGRRVITIDVDGALVDVYEQSIYVLARVDQEAPTP